MQRGYILIESRMRKMLQGKYPIACHICCLIVSVAGPQANAATGFYKPPQKGMELTHAYISPAVVASTLGKFLLVRKGRLACAIKFTSFHRDGEEKMGTVFFSREPIRTAEVEWYYQNDGSFDFTKHNVTLGKVSLRNTSSFGFGRISFKPMSTLGFVCGTIPISWYDGIHIGFTDMNGRDDFEREMAPSKWSDLNEVDFTNSRLIWTKVYEYQIERERAPKTPGYIPVDELP